MFSSVKKYYIRSAVIAVLGLAAGAAAAFNLVYEDASLRAEIDGKYKNSEISAEIISEEISEPININTASARELRQLNGIGETKARAIVEYREQYGEFRSADDLLNVRGIGEKTLENIRNDIMV